MSFFSDPFGIGAAARSRNERAAARDANRTQLQIATMFFNQQREQAQLTARAQIASAQSAERTAITLGRFDAAQADAARVFQSNQDIRRFNFARDQLAAQTGLAEDRLRVSASLTGSQLDNQREAVRLQTGTVRQVAQLQAGTQRQAARLQAGTQREAFRLQADTQRQALQNQNTLNLLQQATRRDTLRFIASGDVSAFTADEGRVLDEALASSRASRGIIFTGENMRDRLRERQGDLIRRAGVARAVGQSFGQATQVDRALSQTGRQNAAEVAMGSISAAAAAAAAASRNSASEGLQRSRSQAVPQMALVDTSERIDQIVDESQRRRFPPGFFGG